MKTPLLFATMIVMLLTHGFVVAQDTTLTITPAGRVGIGKSAPAYKLDVNGEVNATGVRVNGVPVATGSGSQWTTSGNNLYNGNTGNVGVGTTLPAHKLDVNGAINATSFLLNGSPLSTGSQWTTSGSNIHYNSGNVGIGTTAPAQRLQVDGQGVFTASSVSQDPGDGLPPATRIGFDGVNNFGYINANHTGLGARNLILQGDPNGANVGIGTTTPGAKLEVRKPGSGITSIFGRGNDPAFALVAVQKQDGNAPDAALGVVGISYNGGDVSKGIFFFRGDNANNGSTVLHSNAIDGGPFIGIYGFGIRLSGNTCYTGSLAACSDVRFKKDIVPLTNALDNLGKLEGVSYYWKAKEFPDKNFSDKKQIGVLAQEVEKIYPELVTTDNDGYKWDSSILS